MAEEQGPENVFHREVQQWELEMIKKVAQAFRTDERADLEAELARRLLMLKENRPSNIRSWKAYLAKFLYNKGANWIRDQRSSARRGSAIPDVDESIDIHMSLPGIEQESDLRLAFSKAWNELDPELRRFWQVLAEEEGNQVHAAKRLGKHRNTVRLWVRKIKEALAHHGFR